MFGIHDVLPDDGAVSGESFIEELPCAVYISVSSEFQFCLMPEPCADASAFILQNIIRKLKCNDKKRTLGARRASATKSTKKNT